MYRSWYLQSVLYSFNFNLKMIYLFALFYFVPHFVDGESAPTPLLCSGKGTQYRGPYCRVNFWEGRNEKSTLSGEVFYAESKPGYEITVTFLVTTLITVVNGIGIIFLNLTVLILNRRFIGFSSRANTTLMSDLLQK